MKRFPTLLVIGLFVMSWLFSSGAHHSVSAQIDPCDTDINIDGVVDIQDYSLLVTQFLKSPLSTPRADINKDSVVDLTDSSLLIGQLLTKTQHCNSPTIKIMTIGFNPTEDGVSYADTYFGQTGYGSAEQIEQRVWNHTKEAMKRITHDTYKFEIVKSIQVTTSPTYPDGYSFNLADYSKCVWGRASFQPEFCEQRKLQFNYPQWIQDQQICQKAQEVDADEIWMLSLPYMMAWENFMIGPTSGFNVNGASYQVPGCGRHLIVVNGTYDRPTNLLHNVAHRVEATMKYLTQTWTETNKYNHWEKFAAIKLYSGILPNLSYCGNGHFPSNTFTGYDYSNTQFKLNTCNDWNNFPNYTSSSESINCSYWNCSDEGWQEYWLSRLPHSKGEVTFTSAAGKTFTFPKNWWGLLLHPDEAISKRKEM